MNKLLSAAIGTALLLSSTGGALAQTGFSGDGQVRTVQINNFSSYTIEYVYAVPTSWSMGQITSGDFIPGRVIQPSESTYVDFDRGDRQCLLDIRAVDTRGGDWVFRAVDVCRGQTLNLRN